MAKCRLKNNFIIGKEFLTRGSVLDDSKLPEHLRSEQHVDYQDLAGRQNRVLLLHGLQFSQEQIVHGQRTGFPVTLEQGQLLDLSELSERERADLKEGIDFKSNWTEQERLALVHEWNEKQNKLTFDKGMTTYAC